MHVAIFGNSTPDESADALARAVAKQLSQPRDDKTATSRYPKPCFKLATTGGLRGVPGAVREGALESSARHVSMHFVEALHPDITERYPQEAGFYPVHYMSFDERANFASNCAAVIFLALNRANIGTALTLLHGQRTATARLLTVAPPKRKLLFWASIFRNPHELRLAELTRHFGRYADAEDLQHVSIFNTADEVVAAIRTFDTELATAPLHL